MPEETDTIVLYNGNWTLSFTIEAAVRLFEEQYPDVNVVVQNYGDEIDTIIRTEIPAGKGPDLLYANVDDLPDVYKAMETGLFEDLGPYEEKDADFTLDDYISGIMDASLFCGKQYILPVQHSSLVLTTTEEALRDAGVAVSELALFPSFASAAIRFRAEHPEGHLFAWDDDIYEQKHLSLFRDLYTHCGLEIFDYENRTVVLDREKLWTVCDLCKAYVPTREILKKLNPDEPVSSDYTSRDAIISRECLFNSQGAAGYLLMHTHWMLQEAGETPLTRLVPDLFGGTTTEIYTYAAISVGAENKLNAWRFIKILLSEEIQGDGREAMSVMQPVLKAAVKDHLSYDNYRDVDVDALIEPLQSVDRATIFPPVLWKYLRDNMMPYIEGKKDFAECFDKLVNVLELYIDE